MFVYICCYCEICFPVVFILFSQRFYLFCGSTCGAMRRISLFRCRDSTRGVAKPSKRDVRGVSVCRSSNAVRPSRSPGQVMVCQPMPDHKAAPVYVDAVAGTSGAVCSNSLHHVDLDLAM